MTRKALGVDAIITCAGVCFTGTSILKGVDDYMALLDEHITMTQAMTFSTFKGPFEERIESWNSTLQVQHNFHSPTKNSLISEPKGLGRRVFNAQKLTDCATPQP